MNDIRELLRPLIDASPPGPATWRRYLARAIPAAEQPIGRKCRVSALPGRPPRLAIETGEPVFARTGMPFGRGDVIERVVVRRRCSGASLSAGCRSPCRRRGRDPRSVTLAR
jgi:hypothetical protein